MQALNYFGKAIADLESIASANLGKEWDRDKEMAGVVAGLIRTGMKFDLPDFGRIFDDELRGIIGEQIRLPAPVVCLEYFVPNEPNFPMNEYSPKRIAIAIESPSKDEEGVYDINVISLSTSGVLDHFMPCPVIASVGKEWDKGFGLRVVFPQSFNAGSPTDGSNPWDSVANDIADEMRAVLELCEALTCSNVTTEILQRADKHVNDKRARRGKAPIYETRVLVINAPEEIHSKRANGGGTHASPRQHLRRGHIRRISPKVEGDPVRKIWVNSCVVGNAENGVIVKKYSVKKRGA